MEANFTSMPQLHLILFGSFQLTVGGQSVERLRSLREAALLAYLATEADRSHPRTQLAGLLWPDLPEISARNNLKQTLLNLRETIRDRDAQPPLLYADRTTIQFNRASSQWVDVLVFGDALRATAQHAHPDLLACAECQARLAQAVALYQGPLLANFALSQSDLFEEWVLLAREQFHNQMMLACGQLSAIYAQQGNHTEALTYVRRQIELDPFHEPAQRQLLTLLTVSGDRSGALVQFDNFRVRLQNELGVEPSPETLSLVEQIRTSAVGATSPPAMPRPLPQAPAAPAPVIQRSDNLPSAQSPSEQRSAGLPLSPRHDWGGIEANPRLIGRTTEETQVRGWLQAGARVITLWGLAGVGKTALAQALARGQATGFAGIIWRSLTNAPPLDTLLADWLAILSDPPLPKLPQSLDLQFNLLFAALRQRRVLLVLDNLESVMQPEHAGRFRPGDEGYGQLIQRMAQDNHQSVLLLTSREEPQLLFHLAEENPAVRTLLLTSLTVADSQQLLTGYGLVLSTAEATPLVQRFSGNPRILKFVAHSVQELFGGDAAAFLAAGWPVYGDIRDIFQEYATRLPLHERLILMWLAIARVPAALTTLQAAMQPLASPSTFLEALHALQRRALLEQTAAGFTLPPGVMGNLIDYLLETSTQEIVDAAPFALSSFLLFDEQAADAVRQEQQQEIMIPLVERLRHRLGQVNLTVQLRRLLEMANQTAADTPGYLVKNVANLLVYVTNSAPFVTALPPSLALTPTATLSTAPSNRLADEFQGLAEPVQAPAWQTSGRAQHAKLREATLDAPPPAFLPEPLTSFIGREPELAELVERLQEPAVRLLTLVGAGGMGKTSLALAIGQAILDLGVRILDSAESPLPHPKSKIPNRQYADGVFFVALAPLTSSAALPSAIGTTMGLSLQDGDPRQTLCQQLRDKQLLLILDNIEHLLHEASVTDFLVLLLQVAPGVQLLTTSRERLNLRGEHLYHVQPLAFAERASLAEMAATPAIRMFVQSAQRNAADFTLTATNLPDVLRICRLVQGMPLGLELAAANVGLLPLADIASEIEQSAEFLAVDWQDVPTRQRSIRAVFEWSWQLLNEVEQRTLRQIAIFRGGFTREAAQQITGAGLPALMGLMRKSLLQRSETSATTERFQMHELLRQFAAEQLAYADELAAVEAQHSHFYLTFVANRAKRLARREPLQASEEIQAEIDNVRQAWTWAANHGQIVALDQAAYGWWQFCLFRGLGSEGKRTFALAGEGGRRQLAPLGNDATARQQGEQALSKLLAIHANYLFAQGQDETMAAEAREAVTLGETSAGVEGETFGAFVLGRVLQELNLRPESAAAWEKTIALARAYQPKRPDSELLYEAEWMALNWLRGYALHFNDFAKSRTYIDEALQLCQTLGKQRGELFCSADRAWLHFFRCDFAAASQGFSETLHLADALDYAWGEMMAQQGLGEMMRLHGEYGAAQALLNQAVKLAADIGDQYEEIMGLCRLLRLYTYLGDRDRGQAIYQRLDQTLAAAQLPKECHLNSLLAFSVRALYREEYANALTYAQQAQQIVQTGDLLSRCADVAMILGHTQVAMQQWSDATASYQAAIAYYAQLDNAVLAVEAQAGLAQVAQAQGNLAQAQQWVETLLPILAEQPHAGFTTPFGTYLTCYQVLAANQDARAAALIEIAYKLLQEYAASIHDAPWQKTFLENVSVHRQIQQLYAGNSPG